MSLCQFSPARRTPIGRPSSVTFETTTISGLPDTLQRSPKMLNSISPKRRVKATCCGGVICWPRKKITPYSLYVRSITANVASSIGLARSTARISAPSAAPVGIISIGLGAPTRGSACVNVRIIGGRRVHGNAIVMAAHNLGAVARSDRERVGRDQRDQDRVRHSARAADAQFCRQLPSAARRTGLRNAGFVSTLLDAGIDGREV